MAIQSIQKIQPDTFLTLINTFANGWDDLIELLRTIGIGALEAISLPSASTVVGGGCACSYYIACMASS